MHRWHTSVLPLPLLCREKKFTGFNREREQQEQTYASISGIRQTDTHTDLSWLLGIPPNTHTHTLLTSNTVTDLTMLLTELISRCYEHTCLHPITWTLLPHHLVEIVLLGFLLSSLKVSGWRNQVVWVTRRMSLSPLYSSLTTSS